jgi:hypothetical protein
VLYADFPKRKGLITRIPGRQRYLVTPLGRRVAVLFTKPHARMLTPGLAALDPHLHAASHGFVQSGRLWLDLAWCGSASQTTSGRVLARVITALTYRAIVSCSVWPCTARGFPHDHHVPQCFVLG